MPSNERWRAPRLRVVGNGAVLAGVLDGVVASYAGFAADTFRVRAALLGQTALWASQRSVQLEVQLAAESGADFASLIDGQVDLVGIDPIAGLLMLEGRDGAAVFIEARIQETFANSTASEIATQLAARHGLAADVDPTATPVGRYWQLEHDSLVLDNAARSVTEWDLLAQLAGWEGYDLWVSAGTLHFRSMTALGTVYPLQIAAPFGQLPDVMSVRIERALTLAGDIAVAVKSWHSRLGAGTVQRVETQRGEDVAKDYIFIVPNLTADAALRLANRKLAELSSQEIVLTVEMPGELQMTPRDSVQLVGTGSPFDTVFRIAHIERRISVSRGFTQTVVATASS